MTTPTSMGNHGGTVTSCSPYAYPGFAEICILLRTWSTVALGTYELAFLIKKKKDAVFNTAHYEIWLRGFRNRFFVRVCTLYSPASHDADKCVCIEPLSHGLILGHADHLLFDFLYWSSNIPANLKLRQGNKGLWIPAKLT